MFLTKILKPPQPPESHSLPSLSQVFSPMYQWIKHLYNLLFYTEQQELLRALARHSNFKLSILIKLVLSVRFSSRSWHVGDLPSGPEVAEVNSRVKSSVTWDNNCVLKDQKLLAEQLPCQQAAVNNILFIPGTQICRL